MARLLPVLAFLLSAPLFAHGGGLDKNGCHTNHKTGDYHCHGGTTAPSTPAYRAPASAPVASAPVSGLAPRGEMSSLGPFPGTDSCKAIETLLKALGYFQGVPDSKPDRASLDSAIRFRRDHQLTPSITPMDGPLLVRLSETVLVRGK